MEASPATSIHDDVAHSEVIEKFRRDISEGEFNVAALVADQSSCDWAYSIGLAGSYDHPELLIIGLEASLAGMVIEVLGRGVADGRRISAGETVEAADFLLLEARSVDSLWLSQGAWFDLGREVMLGWGQRWPETIQLLWADADGAYPSVPGDPEWSFRQPLLASEARQSRAGLTG